MSDDARAMLGGGLSHDEAQTLISLRMDGPLDIERIRQLDAHVAGCPTCATFAAAMAGMAIGFRELPLLPPSPVVARAVRAEVRKGGVFRSIGRWITASRALPIGALGAATVALAVIAATTVGPLRDGGEGPQVLAPLAATSAAEVAYATGPAAARKTAAPLNVQVEPTAVPPTAVIVVVTATIEPVATEQPAGEPTIVMVAAAETGELAATESSEPRPTEIQAVVTDTPRPLPTATPEPPATATETAEPTATFTPAATATGIIVVTSEADELSAEATVASAGGDSAGTSPAIKPRDPAEPTAESAIGGGESDSSSGESLPADASVGSGDQFIVQRGADSGDAAGAGDAASAETRATDAGGSLESSLPAAATPVAFDDLQPTGRRFDASGTLLPSIVGDYYAVERPDGMLWVLDGDGVVVDEDFGFTPVWSSDSPVVYTADAILLEGKGAMLAWDAAAGTHEHVTSGVDADGIAVLDTPVAWVDGDLWFLRYRPGGSPSLELRTLNGDEQLWAADGIALVGQNIYASGREVYAPTDLGWLIITPGQPEEVLGGSAEPADERLLSPAGDEIAFIAAGRVLVGSARNPGGASEVGSVDGGGIAWTPYGLVIADGAEVRLVGQGIDVSLVVDGDGLSSPVWTGDGLLVLGGDGELSLLPTADLEAMLGF